MIYNRSDRRLEYPTCKAIETPNHLIINGYLYDKKTLTRVSTEQIDVGWNNYPADKYRLGVRHRYYNSIRTDYTYGRDYQGGNTFYDLVDENGYINGTAMWIDQDDPSIEWVWCGDSVLKIDIHKKTVKRINGNYRALCLDGTRPRFQIFICCRANKFYRFRRTSSISICF